MKNFNKLFISLIILSIGFMFNLNSVKAETIINGTCEYQFENETFIVNIKDSKITGVRTMGNVDKNVVSKDSTMDLKSLDILSFMTQSAKPTCPSTMKISHCNTMGENVTFNFALHTGNSLNKDAKAQLQKKCGNLNIVRVDDVKLNKSNLSSKTTQSSSSSSNTTQSSSSSNTTQSSSPSNTTQIPSNIDMVCGYKLQPDVYDVQFLISIKNSKFDLSINKTSAHGTGLLQPTFKIASGINENYFNIQKFIDSSGKTKCPDTMWVTTWSKIENTSEDFYYALHHNETIDSNLAESVKRNSGAPQRLSLDSTKQIELYVRNGEGIQTNIAGNVTPNDGDDDDGNTSDDDTQNAGCGFIGPNTLEIIEWIIKIIRIIVPILIIALGMVDFASVLFNGDDKNFKDAGTRFIKRLAAGIILIFVPYILALLINISGITGDYEIDPDNIFCVFTLDESKK